MILNPCDIEDDLIAKVTTLGYATYNAIPITVPANNAPFFVVSADTKIQDMNAYYFTTISLMVFVYNNGGFKNDKKIKIMINAINTIFPFSSNLCNYDVNPTIVPMGKTTDGYFVNTILIDTVIKKK